MFYSPDLACPRCKECLFDVDETGLIYTCTTCRSKQEFLNGEELTKKYIEYVTKLENLEIEE